jgi:hypothetical protein
MMSTLRDLFAGYRSSAQANDAIHQEFTRRVDGIPYLKEHRDWVERNDWGFGDRAFHYLWHLLLTEDVLTRPDPSALEIGVYKGQVISLWSLVAARAGAALAVYGVTPLAGRPQVRGHFHRLAMGLSRRYREDAASGNFYARDDYRKCVARVYAEFGLDPSSVRLLRGRSQDERVKRAVSNAEFDLVYIDGGHRYEEVTHDIRYYGERVKRGGYLVLDDASVFLPGTVFWKGHETVSRAAEEIDAGKFANVLNVGHNRVYRRAEE